MDKPQIIERYYNLCIRYLSLRPRSEKEIVDYLSRGARSGSARKKFAIDDQTRDEIIRKLKKYNFINDLEFVKFWIEQRIKFKHKPLRAIEYELKQKGIDRDLINEVLLSFEQTKTVDLESAKKLAEKKLDFYRSLPSQKRREKVMNYLLRKGFSYETVREVLKEFN